MARSYRSRIDTVKPLLNPWFILSSGLFILHYFLQHSGIPFPLADAYLDDLLCMPVVLSIALAGMRFFHKSYFLSHVQIIVTVIYCSLLFELALPFLSKTYTSDIMDVGLYVLGAWFFRQYMNDRSRYIRRSPGANE
jgi:hypothetical protein